MSDPLISYQDLSARCRRDAAWVAFRDEVYDITDFLRRHPGSVATLLPALGTDVTHAFEALHGRHVRRMFQRGRGVRRVGRLDPSRPWEGGADYQSRRRYRAEDPLWEDLQAELAAWAQGRSLKKPLWACVGLTLMFWALYLGVVWTACLQASIVAALLWGAINTFMAVNPAHTQMHGAFARNRAVGWLARSLLDAGGYSSFGWDIEHLNHHESPHALVDVQTFDVSLVRFFRHQPHRPWHRGQMLWIWLAMVLYTPSQMIIHTWRVLFRYPCLSAWDKAQHLLVKGLGTALPLAVLFTRHEPLTALATFGVFCVSASYVSIFLLFIQHEDAYVDEDAAESWAERQVLTSSTWSTRNKPLQWLLGYFNYHTEHHLFPGVDPALYPALQPMVKRVCARHGVPYRELSYGELVRSQLRAWRAFAGRSPSPGL